jgi:hypothetical protein
MFIHICKYINTIISIYEYTFMYTYTYPLWVDPTVEEESMDLRSGTSVVNWFDIMIYICIYIHIYLHINIYMYIYISLWVDPTVEEESMDLRSGTSVVNWFNIIIYICIYIHIYLHINIYMYIYIYLFELIPPLRRNQWISVQVHLLLIDLIYLKTVSAELQSQIKT